MFFRRDKKTEESPDPQPGKAAGAGVSGGGGFRRLWDATLPSAGCGGILSQRIRLGIICRAVVVFFVFAGGLAYLVQHTYKVQIRDAQILTRKSLKFCLGNAIYEEARGRIYDKYGNLFASDVATQDIMAEPRRFAAQLDAAVEIIARNLGLEPAALKRKFESAISYRFGVAIARVPSMNRRQAQLLKLDGVEVVPRRDGGRMSYSVVFRPPPGNSVELRQRIHLLAEAFGVDEDDLNNQCDRARKRFREVVVMRNVQREVSDRVRQELRDAGSKSGVRLADSWERRYPRNNELANMLGFTDSSRNGVFGIEALMDDYLKPTRGVATFLHDRWNRPVGEGVVFKVEPSPGADVYLTIQEPIQQIVEEELAVMCEKNDPVRAYAIMMDPLTGQIMALAQYPQINPNDRSTLSDPARCQAPALVQAYDPGSIMKAVSLTGVLQNRVAGLETMVDCEGGRWYYGGRPLRDSHGYGDLSLAEVIQKSSNIGTAKFSLQMGEEEMFKYLDGYGLGQRTGVGFYPHGRPPVVFKGEARGSFRAYRNWDTLTITRIPMGQGVSLTPMQIMQTWSALANNGTIMQPYIVDRVKYPDGRVEYSEPRVKYTPASEAAVAKMVQALKLVTKKGGTGTRAAVPGYEVAGKTGTAQFWIPADPATGRKGHYSEREYFASFIGFAPADNPRFLLLVSAENPRKGYHTGSGVSAPVFGRIAARTLEYLQVPPDDGDGRPPSAPSATALR